jgi:4-hydroxysphinganine ceramide fatty acyl 2-hydroxylase
MPSFTLPSFTRTEVESHNSQASCYVTLGANVYDLTDFLDSHPGGADLILNYAGKDVSDILKDESSHLHSDAAYEVLDDSLIGYIHSEKSVNGKATNGTAKTTGVDAAANGNGVYVHPRTGMAREEDLSKETDYDSDYQKHKFLDLNRPLFPQIWYGGFTKRFYLDQIHRPRHYKGGQSAPLFGNFLEPLTKTPWWLIPTIWLPPVLYGLYRAREGFSSAFEVAFFWGIGFFVWSLLEYILHRFLFHLD